MSNSVDPNQTAPGAVCSGSTLFASILNSSVMLGNYLQQTTFSDAFFLGALSAVRHWKENLPTDLDGNSFQSILQSLNFSSISRNRNISSHK